MSTTTPIRLREETAELRGFGDALDADGNCRLAQRDVELKMSRPDVIEGFAHRLFQAVVKQFRLPEVALQVLGPFEVRRHDAAGVREDVRHDRDTATRQNVGSHTGRRTV